MSTKNEILRSFPSKGTTDVLIARFFDVYNQDPSFQIIHGPTYQKQYDQHWRAPQDSDIVWLGLTYSMMMVALVSYHKNGDEPLEYRGRTEQMYRDYKRLTAQSLMLIDFTKGAPYVLELYLIYLLADLNRSRDLDINIIIGISILVRHTMRMGIHRDSKYFPDLSPFQGEMRRRIWAMVKQADLKVSSQYGLPPMIQTRMTNTEMMRNLYDDELDEKMKELPESRSLSEQTPISFLIYKTHLTDVAYEIVDETQKLGVPSYEKTMELDRKLRKVRDEIPPQFKFRPYDESLRDSPDIILKRYHLEISFLKYLLLIHRKFSICTRYPYSARTGLESAMDILKHQQSLHNEQRSGRRLGESKMLVGTLTTHDYLLAAMIVCMSLYRSVEEERAGRSPFDPSERTNRPALMAAIEGSYRIWEGQKDESMEAFKAAGTLNAMITMLRQHQIKIEAQASPYGTSPYTPASSDDVKLAPEHSAAMTLNMLSSGAMTPGASLFSTTSIPMDSAPSAPAQTGTMPATFDGIGPVSMGSPFSNLFGNNPGFQSIDAPNSLDWVSTLPTLSSG
jgi:Fungal specific transcription factor domain